MSICRHTSDHVRTPHAAHRLAEVPIIEINLVFKVRLGLLNRADSFALSFPIIFVPPHFFLLLLQKIFGSFVDS